MAFNPLGVALALDASRQFLPALLRNRRIGTIVADVTIEEQGTDELAITEHPIENGADITDHSYKKPAKLTIRAGWTNSSPFSIFNPTFSFAGLTLSPTGVSRAGNIYAQLLSLQASRVPFEVVTGKRTYTNMLIARLYQQTDEKTENSLVVTADFQEALIVNTQTLSTLNPNAVKFKQSFPTLDKGTQNLQPATSLNTQ